MICKYNKKARTKKIRAKLFLKRFVNRSSRWGCDYYRDHFLDQDYYFFF